MASDSMGTNSSALAQAMTLLELMQMYLLSKKGEAPAGEAPQMCVCVCVCCILQLVENNVNLTDSILEHFSYLSVAP